MRHCLRAVQVIFCFPFFPRCRQSLRLSRLLRFALPPLLWLRIDPYFSVWSMADKLTDAATRHWTGVEQAMNGIVRVDGNNYRFLGAPGRRRQPLPALKEVSHTITPTRTIVVMTSPEIELRVESMTPAFPNDMKVMARPSHTSPGQPSLATAAHMM